MIIRGSKIILTNFIEGTLVMTFAAVFGSIIIWVLFNRNISIALILCFIAFMIFVQWKVCSYNVLGEESILHKRLFYKTEVGYSDISNVKFDLGGLSRTNCVIKIYEIHNNDTLNKVYIECTLSQKEVQKVRDFLHEKGVETEFFIFDKKIA